MARTPKRLKRVRYTVSGNGSFPTDMLRYDASHCATDEDLAEAMDPRKQRSVNMVTHLSSHVRRDWEPTAGRWASFGWRVEPDSIKREMVDFEEVPPKHLPLMYR